MVLGVKEGRYFQGRFNISRLLNSEATVRVGGLNQELLIASPELQNRALSGDIVCVELLPQEQWIKNYQSGAPADLMYDSDEENIDEVKSVEDNKNLIEMVNTADGMQVTCRVKGILKRLNKTYGGSVLRLHDMLESTKVKLELFFK